MRSFALLARLTVALGFSVLSLGAAASPDNPQNGRDYRTLEQAQRTDSADRVEVTEFFWYSCPHCNALEPELNEWVKKQGDKIVFKRVPVAFRDSMVPQQKLYYALEAMDSLDTLHAKVFHAIHVQRKSLDRDESIANWIAEQGVDKQKFLAVYNSFGVQSKVRRASQLQQAYQVDGVPLLAVAGRYMTSPSIVGSSIGNRPAPVLHAATFQVLEWLITRSTQAQPKTSGSSAAPVPKGAAVAN